MKLLFLRLCLRFALIATVVYGLYINLYAAFGAFQPWLLLFYTTQSNALVMCVFAVACLYDLKLFACRHCRNSTPQWIQTCKIALTWAISITGLVWHLLLVPYIESHADLELLTPALLLSFSLLHTWSPLLAFLDWILFDPKGTIQRLAPLKWLLIPAGYFVFICVWVAFVGPVHPELGFVYPYPFIDFTIYSPAIVWRNVLAIALGVLVLGYFYYATDKLLAKTGTYLRRLRNLS